MNAHGTEGTFKNKETTTFIIREIQHNSQFLMNQMLQSYPIITSFHYLQQTFNNSKIGRRPVLS